VQGARAYFTRVLVVDDGSTDGTGAAATAAGAEVVVHAVNSGKGVALRTGLGVLARDGVGRALTLDADGQHLPHQIPLLLSASDAQPDAFVVGVRKKAGHTIRRINKFGNWFADRALRAIARQPIPDTQSGFRVYPVATTLSIPTVGDRFDFETEILLRAARRGLRVVGVPVEVHYPPVAERVSHYRVGRDTYRIIRTVLRVLRSPA
jgi:glycosyltransferase involved in cell wall biosynthesis